MFYCYSRNSPSHDLRDQPGHGYVLGNVSVDGHGDHGKTFQLSCVIHMPAVTVVSKMDALGSRSSLPLLQTKAEKDRSQKDICSSINHLSPFFSDWVKELQGRGKAG